MEGADSSAFNISTGGALSFASPPDHENATDADTDNVYEVTVVATDGSEAGRLDVSVRVTGVDEAPTADAGADQTVADGTEVTLDGSGSADVDGDTLTYLWAQTAPDSGADVTLSSTAAEQPTFTAPERETDVTLTFELKVSDDGGATYSAATDTVDVTVTAQDDAPTADAGADQTVADGTEVTLDGSGSTDPEGAQLTYSWSQTAPASGEGSGVTLSSTTAQSPTFTAPTQLSNDVTLTFSLTVNDATNTSTAATVNVTVIAVPAAPTNLEATPSDGQVALTWEDPGNTSITKYQVRSDGGTSFADIPGSDADTASHTVTGLTNGTDYSFEVRAVNGSGNGAVSTVAVTMVPAAPTNLSATPGDGQVALTWDDPGNTTITKYRVSTDGGTSFTDIDDSSAITTGHTVTSLTNDNAYILAVRAVNDSGNGPASISKSTTPVAVPAKPSGLTAEVTGDSQVVLTWDNPDNTTITGYQLRVDNGDWAAIAESDKETTSHTVTGLDDGESYNFYVRAVNVSGPGLRAQTEASIAHRFQVPDAPSGLEAVAGDGQVALTWDPSSFGDIWYWQYRQKQGAGAYGDWTAIDGSSASTTGHTVTDLTNGTEYTFSPTSATQRQNSRNLLIFGSRSQKVGTTNASLISVVTPARRFLAAVVRAGCG